MTDILVSAPLTSMAARKRRAEGELTPDNWSTAADSAAPVRACSFQSLFPIFSFFWWDDD